MSKVKPASKGAGKKKGAKGYKLPDPIPSGEILTDVLKRQWRIGPSIGVGGFGEIYSACEASAPVKNNIANPYVIKIEPHENGPLFVEMHFYKRVGKSDEIQEWKNQKKLQSFGMPRFVASGTHECNSQKYRFVVMDRFSKDLWSLFVENGRVFPYQTVLRIGHQVIDVLEYIHSKGYVHADIKGANLLLGNTKDSKNQVYLVDFGMASKSTKDGKPDPKKAHNGTPEYTSRDTHAGVMSYRGDMEILGYNMLQWLCSYLPWEDLSNVVKLQEQKVKYMSDIPALMKKCFNKTTPPSFIVKYFEYVSKMKIDEAPKYDYCRGLIKDELKKSGCSIDGILEFSTPLKTVNKTPSRGKAKKAKAVCDDEDDSSSPKKPRTNGKKQEVISSSDDDDESDDLPLVKKTAAKKLVKKAKVEATKPSWKDCPTAVNSAVTRAGEYQRVNGNNAKSKN